jgi:hypothetical protein
MSTSISGKKDVTLTSCFPLVLIHGTFVVIIDHFHVTQKPFEFRVLTVLRIHFVELGAVLKLQSVLGSESVR